MLIQSRREGFAIPMAILLIGVITAGVVGAFARIESEAAVLNNSSIQTDAYALAEAGMNQFLSERQAPPAGTVINLTGGTATIQVDVMRADDGVNGALYLIRSTGRPTVGAAAAPAEHTIAMLGWYQRGQMQVLSSWTSLSGLRKNGASGSIAGEDACGVEGTVAGVALPDGGFSGKDDAISGNPDIDEMGSEEELAEQINIDWNAIVNENAMAFDYMVPPQAFPTQAQFAADPDWWPVIYIDNRNGDFSAPGGLNGRGTLVVRGDLTIGGGDRWDGIILVGGKITDNGNGSIAGAVVSGLNIKLGEEVGESSRANGTKAYAFDSCKVSEAASQFSTLIPMSNTWIDNWAAY